MTKAYANQISAGMLNLNLGIKDYKTGKYTNATTSLGLAIDKLPQNDKGNLWKAHFYRALSYHLQGEKKLAKYEIKKALDQIPKNRPDPDIHSRKIIKWFLAIKKESKKDKKLIAKRNKKKPIYKKWWFWTIVAGLAGGAVAMGSGGGGGGDSGGGGTAAPPADGGEAVIRW